MVKSIVIQKIVCKRCSHSWVPRQQEIYVCPKCKSPRWNAEEGIIRIDKDIDFDSILDIIANNEIFKEDLKTIGDVVRR